jgi:hypothetical protein
LTTFCGRFGACSRRRWTRGTRFSGIRALGPRV